MAGLAGVFAAAVVLFLIVKRRKGWCWHIRKWTPEGVFPGGSLLECCRGCGARKVWVMTHGMPIRIDRFTRKKWEEVMDAQKVSATALRGHDHPEEYSPGAGGEDGYEARGAQAAREREQRLRERRRRQRPVSGGLSIGKFLDRM